MQVFRDQSAGSVEIRRSTSSFGITVIGTIVICDAYDIAFEEYKKFGTDGANTN